MMPYLPRSPGRIAPFAPFSAHFHPGFSSQLNPERRSSRFRRGLECFREAWPFAVESYPKVVAELKAEGKLSGAHIRPAHRSLKQENEMDIEFAVIDPSPCTMPRSLQQRTKGTYRHKEPPGFDHCAITCKRNQTG